MAWKEVCIESSIVLLLLLRTQKLYLWDTDFNNIILTNVSKTKGPNWLFYKTKGLKAERLLLEKCNDNKKVLLPELWGIIPVGSDEGGEPRTTKFFSWIWAF